ncbi:HigA family addiction module antitoxin [Limosilactobacillus sp.]|jgi:addiction module HigA family antidote|uniref:HigA family addiction module antitoxin n=1 Tax=Limosilactobacillus sp. TaxID=2773925 RepID=UPI0025C1CF03|nr:HigA family addiction module antitoxin [Limosilactobacillus sp.]MCI2031611.1 HigA family addiction module antitoxin [Limosilactobacillus sp.]
MEVISSPTIGEILKEEFMKPLNLSVDRIANAVSTPASKIQDILNNNQMITVDTSIRLGKLFGVSDYYFLNLQSDINTRNNKKF